MSKSVLGVVVGFIVACSPIYAQPATSGHLTAIDIKSGEGFSGFELLKTGNKRFFFLGEATSHNLRQTPAVTLKFLKYLHKEANVRILAIEHGYSVAYLINQYLEKQDTVLLRQISRNTMYWGKENFRLIQQLAEFNNTLPDNQKISVEAIDIEYKAEAAILAINKLIKGRKIPPSLDPVLGEFRRIFEETKSHREQFDGLMVSYYYNKPRVSELVSKAIKDLKSKDAQYKEFFREAFIHFDRIILDLDAGVLNYNYTKPRKHLKFRDNIMFNKMVNVAVKHPEKNILCVIGSRHIERGFSGYRLTRTRNAPYKNQVLSIKVFATKKGRVEDKTLRKLGKKINYNFQEQAFTFIKHLNADPPFKVSKPYEYSLFIRDSKHSTLFENSYFGEK